MKEIIIFGSGDHAKLIYYEILNYKDYKFLGFVNPKESKINIKNKNLNLYSSIKALKKKKIYAIIGVGNNFIRNKIFKETKKIKINIIWEKIISKNAYVSKSAKIGEGTFICQGTNICGNSKIGNHCIINSSSSIDHDNVFKDFSSTGPGVITGGNVKIGNMCHIGIGSTVKNNITINKDIIIGANSFVNKNFKKKGVYFGSPCKFKKKLIKSFNYLK
tara:strand:- start:3124 stop:3777 length:654 start_codon:yes stop_codon:yes gene_type:complete